MRHLNDQIGHLGMQRRSTHLGYGHQGDVGLGLGVFIQVERELDSNHMGLAKSVNQPGIKERDQKGVFLTLWTYRNDGSF